MLADSGLPRAKSSSAERKFGVNEQMAKPTIADAMILGFHIMKPPP